MIWRLYYARFGDHVHCRLFCGPQVGALGKCGDLCMRHKELTEFTSLRRVLPMEFIREVDADGKPTGSEVALSSL